MEFIKIGDEFLVKANITSFKFFPGQCVVRAYTTDGKISEFTGADAVLLLEYLNSPDRTHHINPGEKISAYQDYREREGGASFTEWQRKFDRHQKMMEVENPSRTQMGVIQGLEEFLLY